MLLVVYKLTCPLFPLQLHQPEGLQLKELSARSGGTIQDEKILVTFATPTPFRQDEDYLTGRVLCSLSGPASGCFETEWTENIESTQRREAAQKSETRLDVEPVFPARGVHRQRLPVHWQGETCTPTSPCDFSTR